MAKSFEITVRVDGDTVYGRATDPDTGVDVFVAQRDVDSCAGLGGYDLTELEEAKKAVRKQLEDCVAGWRRAMEGISS